LILHFLSTKNIIFVFAVVGIAGALLWAYKSFAEKASKEVAVRNALINRIKDRMESTESSGQNVVPIDQLKDELLGPQNVNGSSNHVFFLSFLTSLFHLAVRQKAWDDALANVLKYDPRIRYDTSVVGGEEVECLMWVPSSSPKASERSTRSAATEASKKKFAEKVI
jgi:hypothetical protein